MASTPREKLKAKTRERKKRRPRKPTKGDLQAWRDKLNRECAYRMF